MADTRSDALALALNASVSSHTGENDKEPFETVTQYDSAADYPDGGFRAWLIVAGVRISLFSVLTGLICVAGDSRQCSDVYIHRNISYASH